VHDFLFSALHRALADVRPASAAAGGFGVASPAGASTGGDTDNPQHANGYSGTESDANSLPSLNPFGAGMSEQTRMSLYSPGTTSGPASYTKTSPSLSQVRNQLAGYDAFRNGASATPLPEAPDDMPPLGY